MQANASRNVSPLRYATILNHRILPIRPWSLDRSEVEWSGVRNLPEELNLNKHFKFSLCTRSSIRSSKSSSIEPNESRKYLMWLWVVVSIGKINEHILWIANRRHEKSKCYIKAKQVEDLKLHESWRYRNNVFCFVLMHRHSVRIIFIFGIVAKIGDARCDARNNVTCEFFHLWQCRMPKTRDFKLLRRYHFREHISWCSPFMLFVGGGRWFSSERGIPSVCLKIKRISTFQFSSARLIVPWCLFLAWILSNDILLSSSMLPSYVAECNFNTVSAALMNPFRFGSETRKKNRSHAFEPSLRLTHPPPKHTRRVLSNSHLRKIIYIYVPYVIGTRQALWRMCENATPIGTSSPSNIRKDDRILSLANE